MAPSFVERHDGDVAVMALAGAVFALGLALTVAWGGIGYRTWSARTDVDPGEGAAGAPPDAPSVRSTAQQYARGVAIALVGGFWAGALVTGPAMRLIMRLLAVTAGDGAQGVLTEADEVVGQIDLGGTIGLWIFGGILPGLLSGALYLLVRRLLPSGRLGGVVFGAFHLVIGATRIDPLRPDNPDFDVLGPGWASILTFGLACVVHGMAVVAIANRYSRALPPEAPSRRAWAVAIVPLVLPLALLAVVIPALVVVVIGLVVVVAVSQVGPVMRVVGGRTVVVVGRAAVVVLAILMLPGTVSDLHDIVDRSRVDRSELIDG